jgi:hypothetical protein
MSMDTTLPSFGDLTEKVQPVKPAYVSHVVMDGTQVYATCSSRERAEEQLGVIKDINKYLKNHRYPGEHIIVVPHLPANSHVARLRRLAGQLNAMTSSSFMRTGRSGWGYLPGQQGIKNDSQ